MSPSTPKVYRKLIQSCKHFFIKNPIIILSDVYYYNGDGNNFRTYENNVGKNIDYNNLSSKFWIINSFDAETMDSNDHPIEAVVSSIICKLYKCDIKDLRLRNQKIKYDDLMLLSSNVEDVVLNWVNVYRNGNIIPFEQIVEAFPKAEKIQ
uniref:Uncharacterized protein n=1 Tax=Panagrolaimus davidi TaxID=227884 RepID=A0A914NY19_9BILA